MDPRFEATPSTNDIAASLAMWPELSGKRLRPLLVTAFGDIYVEADSGDVYAVKPLELSCEAVAASSVELERLFADPKWAEEALITNLALLASERSIVRKPGQVFAVAPHPSLAGKININGLMAMDLAVWHSISTQLRTPQKPSSGKPEPKVGDGGFFKRLLGHGK